MPSAGRRPGEEKVPAQEGQSRREQNVHRNYAPLQGAPSSLPVVTKGEEGGQGKPHGREGPGAGYVLPTGGLQEEVCSRQTIKCRKACGHAGKSRARSENGWGAFLQLELAGPEEDAGRKSGWRQSRIRESAVSHAEALEPHLVENYYSRSPHPRGHGLVPVWAC